MSTHRHSLIRMLIGLMLGLSCLIASQAVVAGPFEQGVIAYQNKEFKRAHDTWLPLAEHGHVLAQTLLGALYAYGEGVERNDAEAAKWFERAAYAGSAQAQYNLGILYENGWGVEKSLIRARHWYRQAADQGRKDAASRYALISDVTAEETVADQLSGQQPGKPAQPETTELMPTIPIDRPVNKPAEQGQNRRLPALDEAGDTTTWLQTQPAGHYTLQLVASTDPQLLKDSVHILDTTKQHYAIIESRRDTKTWYGLIYGSYKTLGEAELAMQNLPAPLRQYQPWIRPFSNIKTWREQVDMTALPNN